MFDADFRVKRTDESVRWVHGRSLPLYRSDGTHDGFLHVIYDVTDRKLTEHKLCDSLKELKRQGVRQSEQIRNAVAQLRDLLEEVSEIRPGVAYNFERLRKTVEASEAAVDELTQLALVEVDDHTLDDILF